jgi:hypothetical protein
MISSPSRFVVEGVFWRPGVVHSFKVTDPVLFVFGSHGLYPRDFNSFLMTSLLISSSLVYHLTILKKRISTAVNIIVK